MAVEERGVFVNRPYSVFEMQVIELHYAKTGSHGCQGFIKRSKESIQHQARKMGLKFEGKRRPGYRAFKISKHAHPLVKTLFMEIIKQRETQTDIATRAGLHRNSMKNWNAVNPSLENFVAVCNAVELEVCLKRVRA